jgi:hypothetical protein
MEIAIYRTKEISQKRNRFKEEQKESAYKEKRR